MGWNYRKSVPLGPFRLNLSGRGVGASVGVRGLRVGTGPSGNYIHVGGGGLHYRSRLGGSTPARRAPSTPFPVPLEPSSDGLTPIESGDVTAMTDSSSEGLLAEIGAKHRKIRLSILHAWLGGVLILLAWNVVPLWLAFVLIGAWLAGYLYLRKVDSTRKTVSVEYGLDGPQAAAWTTFEMSFDGIAKSRAVWHMEASGRNRDWKRSGGATQTVRRKRIAPARRLPSYFRCNVVPPFLSVGRQNLYFFPDRVLVYDGAKVGAVSYPDLTVDASITRFVESDAVPPDAEVAGHTWQYVNKSGGPDRRFKNNRQIPIALYGELRLTSGTGLTEEIETSRKDAPAAFASALQLLAAALQGEGRHRPVDAVAAVPVFNAKPRPHSAIDTMPVGPGPDGFRFDIVGESHYQVTLEQIAAGRLRGRSNPDTITYTLEVGASGSSSISRKEPEHLVVSCLVVPEPNNAHDPNAIRVDAAGYGTVGYFARHNALEYRALARELMSLGAVGSCEGALYGGWEEGVQVGVKLSLRSPQAWDPTLREHPNALVLRDESRLQSSRVSVGPHPKGFTMEVSAEHYCKAIVRKLDGGRGARGEQVIFDALLVPQPAPDGGREVLVLAEGVGVIGRLPNATESRYEELWTALDAQAAIATCQGTLLQEGDGVDGPWYGAKLSMLPPKKALAASRGQERL